ncbi:hypothetical protein LCGC14_2286880, partial [marine sediment metagenome]
KLKYKIDGDKVKDKLKRDYNTSNLIYGLSAYAGFDSVLLYVKYDLNPIFQDASVEQHNVSLGLRFDLNWLKCLYYVSFSKAPSAWVP